MKHLSECSYIPPQCRVYASQVERVLCASGPNYAPNVIFDENEEEYELS